MPVRTPLARLVAAAALGLTLSNPVAATVDEIVLKNGSKVIGTITGARDGAISIDTDFAGTLSVSLDQVLSMNVQSPVNLQLADKSFLRDKNISVEEEQLVVADSGGAEQSMPLADLLVVNPEPWEMGEGYKWSGIVNFAFAVERGNSDTDELDYSLDTSWRSDSATISWFVSALNASMRSFSTRKRDFAFVSLVGRSRNTSPKRFPIESSISSIQ